MVLAHGLDPSNWLVRKMSDYQTNIPCRWWIVILRTMVIVVPHMQRDGGRTSASEGSRQCMLVWTSSRQILANIPHMS
nr:hypothetical protein CFP56_07968 [Quercus suber]